MQKLPQPTLSYHAALKYATRERLLQLQRAQLREQARQRRANGGILPEHIKSGFGTTTTSTPSSLKPTSRSQKIWFPEPGSVKSIANYSAERSKKKLLNPAMERDFKPLDRVAVMDVPTLRQTYQATKTMKGHIGTVKEVRREAEMCIVEGLQPVCSRFRPVHFHSPQQQSEACPVMVCFTNTQFLDNRELSTPSPSKSSDPSAVFLPRKPPQLPPHPLLQPSFPHPILPLPKTHHHAEREKKSSSSTPASASPSLHQNAAAPPTRHAVSVPPPSPPQSRISHTKTTRNTTQ